MLLIVSNISVARKMNVHMGMAVAEQEREIGIPAPWP
jgi:hypothetical protein